jgi:uncharacterized protein YndB with AHSA1/START domain
MNTKTVSEDTIVQEIAIKSPAERVFAALTKPEELVKWWGVAGKFHATQVESDLRAGGKWVMHGVGADGKSFVVSGLYREVERPRVLVMTWNREGEGWPESQVRWDLEERTGVTTVRLTHSGLTSERMRMQHQGWPMILKLLAAHVEKG